MDSRRRVQFSTFHLLRQLGSFFFSIFYYCSFFVLFSLQQSGAYKAWSKSQSSFCSQFAFFIRPCNFSLQALLMLQGFQCRVSSSSLFCLVVSLHFISSSFSFCFVISLLCVLSVHFILSCCHISLLHEVFQFSTNVFFFIWFHHCYFSLLFFSFSDLTMHSSLIS